LNHRMEKGVNLLLLRFAMHDYLYRDLKVEIEDVNATIRKVAADKKQDLYDPILDYLEVIPELERKIQMPA